MILPRRELKSEFLWPPSMLPLPSTAVFASSAPAMKTLSREWDPLWPKLSADTAKLMAESSCTGTDWGYFFPRN